ncbi:uncharacterized protein IL334_002423 [Kwoniella shivajii]|uniref:Calpain catalytic domain-containing protein n=1 Tax=Kwoniella shivajii TaxID=564305 RepID=A0ABZ1CWD7_9TREE|nr:hypothetical protein IL334_002423 [Kwoniella shivajii]
MSFSTYEQGLKQATELASRAIQIESSLSSLSPLISPLPTLQKAFPAYISAAETYSHLISSSLVPSNEVVAVKKKWRLVLERAEKVKSRIESLGGHVGKVEIGDTGEEAAVLRRGSRANGVDIPLWVQPNRHDFEGEQYTDSRQPELAEEQLLCDPIWKEVPQEDWKGLDENEWTVRQGPVADCSVVAAMGVALEHDRQFGTDFGKSNLYPKDEERQPKRSENGKHVLKLLLNGAWRSVVFDALLPHSSDDKPLYTTCHPAKSSASSSLSLIGAPWVPLALKGYFKVFGGYSLKGSNPAPDIYAYTGWIPERLSLKEGFQREKEWKRIYQSWKKGQVMISLGTGEHTSAGLVRLHAYGVTSIREEDDERYVEVFDPGATTFTMSWDGLCSEFEALHLNWKPEMMPISAARHWSWPKPVSTSTTGSTPLRNPQYRLKVSSPSSNVHEIWILLSQHITSKDRPLDDIALHVFEEYGAGSKLGRSVSPEMADQMSPYANDTHVLVRYRLRQSASSLLVIPARDRGNFQTGFTINVFASQGSVLSLERMSRTLPFSQAVSSSLNNRNAGGHPGHPTYNINPQYQVTILPPIKGGKIDGRIAIQGGKECAWNVKLLWGKGELVFDVTEDMIVADTGAYSYGLAYCDISDLNPGRYTLIVSAFEPNMTGSYTLSLESTAPVQINPIPGEGAGMYSRVINGSWSEETAGGRPSSGGYYRNPRIEVILPKPGVISSRLCLPRPSPVPINMTIFRRGTGVKLGEQVSTTGPYSDALSGVSTGRVKLDSGIYILVPSSYGPIKTSWIMKIWSDVAISVESGI